MDVSEAFGAATSLYAIYLVARRSVWCWPVGLVGIALYGWIFFDAKLYSDMLLQGVFAASQLYGWTQWKAELGDDYRVRVGRADPIELILGLAAGAVGAIALGYVMATMTDAAAPWLDATLTSFSLVGQLWTARRLIQSWYLWFTVDVVYVGLFLFKGLFITAGLYAIFVGLCFYGIKRWGQVSVRVVL
jgi:nicotinamide mononucleotide transporter